MGEVMSSGINIFAPHQYWYERYGAETTHLEKNIVNSAPYSSPVLQNSKEEDIVQQREQETKYRTQWTAGKNQERSRLQGQTGENVSLAKCSSLGDL